MSFIDKFVNIYILTTLSKDTNLKPFSEKHFIEKAMKGVFTSKS